jgi:hypothetical protein
LTTNQEKVDLFIPFRDKVPVPPLSGKQPAFLEYFQYLDNKLERESSVHIPRQPMRRCGVNFSNIIFIYSFL